MEFKQGISESKEEVIVVPKENLEGWDFSEREKEVVYMPNFSDPIPCTSYKDFETKYPKYFSNWQKRYSEGTELLYLEEIREKYKKYTSYDYFCIFETDKEIKREECWEQIAEILKIFVARLFVALEEKSNFFYERETILNFPKYFSFNELTAYGILDVLPNFEKDFDLPNKYNIYYSREFIERFSQFIKINEDYVFCCPAFLDGKHYFEHPFANFDNVFLTTHIVKKIIIETYENWDISVNEPLIFDYQGFENFILSNKRIIQFIDNRMKQLKTETSSKVVEPQPLTPIKLELNQTQIIYLFQQLIENGYLKTNQNPKLWSLISKYFVDKDNKQIKNIHQIRVRLENNKTGKPKQETETIEKMVSLLDKFKDFD